MDDRTNARVQYERARLAAGLWTSDPDLRIQTDMILSTPVIDRLRRLEAEIAFFDSLRPAPATAH